MYSLFLIFHVQYLYETTDNMDGLPFKLHDFGFRGSTSVEVRLHICSCLHSWAKFVFVCVYT